MNIDAEFHKIKGIIDEAKGEISDINKESSSALRRLKPLLKKLEGFIEEVHEYVSFAEHNPDEYLELKKKLAILITHEKAVKQASAQEEKLDVAVERHVVKLETEIAKLDSVLKRIERVFSISFGDSHIVEFKELFAKAEAKLKTALYVAHRGGSGIDRIVPSLSKRVSYDKLEKDFDWHVIKTQLSGVRSALSALSNLNAHLINWFYSFSKLVDYSETELKTVVYLSERANKLFCKGHTAIHPILLYVHLMRHCDTKTGSFEFKQVFVFVWKYFEKVFEAKGAGFQLTPPQFKRLLEFSREVLKRHCGDLGAKFNDKGILLDDSTGKRLPDRRARSKQDGVAICVEGNLKSVVASKSYILLNCSTLGHALSTALVKLMGKAAFSKDHVHKEILAVVREINPKEQYSNHSTGLDANLFPKLYRQFLFEYVKDKL